MSDVIRMWSQAYCRYAQAAVAGGTLPAGLIPQATDGPDFFTALDQSLRTVWMAVAWAGPGLVGTTLLVPPLLPFLLGPSATLFTSPDPQLALSLIADALHTYTLSITVTVVPATGTPLIVPLT